MYLYCQPESLYSLFGTPTANLSRPRPRRVRIEKLQLSADFIKRTVGKLHKLASQAHIATDTSCLAPFRWDVVSSPAVFFVRFGTARECRKNTTVKIEILKHAPNAHMTHMWTHCFDPGNSRTHHRITAPVVAICWRYIFFCTEAAQPEYSMFHFSTSSTRSWSHGVTERCVLFTH